MPNDAKLGLVVGVALVLAVAVVFFRKDSTAGDPVDTNVKSTPANTAPPPRPAVARATQRTQPSAPAETPPRRHTVREGETLFGLAQRYYGDGQHFQLISRANQQNTDAAEPLLEGTVLVIPDMPNTKSSDEES